MYMLKVYSNSKLVEISFDEAPTAITRRTAYQSSRALGTDRAKWTPVRAAREGNGANDNAAEERQRYRAHVSQTVDTNIRVSELESRALQPRQSTIIIPLAARPRSCLDSNLCPCFLGRRR